MSGRRAQGKKKVVVREIDRMKGQGGTDEGASTSTSSTGVMTRHTRQTILSAKRRKLECDEAKDAENIMDSKVIPKEPEEIPKAPEEISKGSEEISNKPEEIPKEIQEIEDMQFQGVSMREMYKNVMSDEPEKQYNGIQAFRRALSVVYFLGPVHNPSDTIDWIIKMGAIPRIIEFLQVKSNHLLQHEASYVIANIVSGTTEQVRVVVDAGAIPILVQLLRSPQEDTKEQAIMALGNIAGDIEEFRDLVLSHGIIQHLISLSKSKTMSLTRLVAWVLSNLCRGKNPPPQLDQVSSCQQLISHFLLHSDVEILTSTLDALVFLTDDESDELVTAIASTEVCSRLVDLLKHTKSQVQTKALQAICNIVTNGNDEHKQKILDASVLPCLEQHLSDDKPSTKMACRIIAGIMAGNTQRIEAVIEAGVFPNLMRVTVLRDQDLRTGKKIVQAISKVASTGNPQQIRYIAEVDESLDVLCELLTIDDDASHTQILLSGLEGILKFGEQIARLSGMSNRYADDLKMSGLDKIESLKRHASNTISKQARDIIQHYFS